MSVSPSRSGLISLDYGALTRPRAIANRLVTRSLPLWLARGAAVVVALAGAGLVEPVIPRVAALLGLATFLLLLLEALRRRALRERQATLLAFADANGLTYTASRLWTEASALTQRVTNRSIVDVFTGEDDAGGLRVGTLAFESERGGLHLPERWTFVARTVGGEPLPHLVVISRHPHARDLPAAIDRAQRLDLEGDFPKHFDVYCTPGDERYALYLLTPDLMASLVDASRLWSLEVSDNEIRFFTPGAFDPEDPGQWLRCASVASAGSALASRRLHRYNRTPSPSSSQPAPGSAASTSPSIRATRKRLRLSIGQSNRSTEVVGAACAAIVLAAVVWAWLHGAS